MNPSRILILAALMLMPATALPEQLLPPFGTFSPGDRATVVREDDPMMQMPGHDPTGKRKKEVAKDGISTAVRNDDFVSGVQKVVNGIREKAKKSHEKYTRPPPHGVAAIGRVLSLDEIRTTHDLTEFSPGRFLGAYVGGVLKNNKWTTASRYFEMKDGSVVMLRESDYGASGGKIYFTPSMINLEINGKPACAVVRSGPDGQVLEQVVWVDGRIAYDMYVLRPKGFATREANGEVDSASLETAIGLARKLVTH